MGFETEVNANKWLALAGVPKMAEFCNSGRDEAEKMGRGLLDFCIFAGRKYGGRQFDATI